MTIDWKNAPEGATHYSPETDATHAVFYKDDFKQMWIEKWSNLGWQEAHSLNEHERPIPRPTSTAIPEPKKLTQAVFDGLPPEYRWAAVDADGDIVIADHGHFFWHESKKWLFPSDSTIKIIVKTIGYDASDWQNSLIEREPSVAEILEAFAANPPNFDALINSVANAQTLAEAQAEI